MKHSTDKVTIRFKSSDKSNIETIKISGSKVNDILQIILDREYILISLVRTSNN